MTFYSYAVLGIALVSVRSVVADNATCADGACEDAGLLQVHEGWGCAGEHGDPYSHHNMGRCCHDLTKVQGQFDSETCTHRCFACTGRSGNKDPYSQCGSTCDQNMCKVPCCEGTHEIKGYWNSGTCSYQCMCAGNGQDVFEYCAGGNPCGGTCQVPCCYPLQEVTEGGRRVCRLYGEILAHALWHAATTRSAAEDAAEAAALPAAAGEKRASATREDTMAKAAELKAVADAAAQEVERLKKEGPPHHPKAAFAPAVTGAK